jgi:hypothetical protein
MHTATPHIAAPHRYGSGWLVPSRTRPGVLYYVSGDLARCTCPGFSYRGACAHLRTVLEAQHVIAQVLGDADDT